MTCPSIRKFGCTTPTPDWAYLGALLANEDSFCQVQFFRAFVRECKSWGTNHQIEQQLAYVNLELDKEERDVLSMLGFN